MLTPKKKISRKELKEDALVTSYVKATTFYEEHKRWISIGVTAVAVLAITLIVYGKNRADNNVSASTELGNIYPLFDSGQFQLAVDGVPERNIKGLKSIVDEFGNSEAGDIARFYLASACYQLGKYDEALDQFKRCSVADETLEISRLSGIASAYEAKGMPKDAAEYFEKAALKNGKDPGAAENLNAAARNYARAGEKEKALDLLRKLKKTYPATTFGREADREIAALSL
jgi:tetratricopeptide (TPR) repeat protein